MNRLIVFILFTTLLFAKNTKVTKESLVQLYKQKEYEKVCYLGYRHFNLLRKSQELVSMYAFSCLYSDYIDKLAIPIMVLSKTKESRHNRTYFSIILAQKNMLYAAIVDNTLIKDVHFPATDHVISRVAHLFFKKEYTKKNGHYFLKDKKDPNIYYEVYQEDSRYKRPYLIIEEHIGTTVIKHKYL